METIMKCYFDYVFTDLDRSFLFAKYKRKELVDYLSNVIQACGNVEGNAREVCEIVVKSALEFHSTTKGNNSQVCLMGKYHNILYVVAKLAFDWNIGNSKIIGELLDAMFNCERTFDRLITGAIFGPKASGIISGWKSDFNSREENINAIGYFLHHSNKAKCVYNIKGRQTRLVDVPMESYAQSTPAAVSVQLCCPDVLLVFLQYGAKVYIDKSPCALEVLVRKLGDQQELCYVNNDLARCCNMLMNATGNVPRPDCYTDHHYLPGYRMLPERRTITCCELKHLCRLAIRESLLENYQLPQGITSLPLPDVLKRFINLQDH